MNRIHKEILTIIGSFDHIIWDWNGTLIDDGLINYEILSIQLQKLNIPVPSFADNRKLFGFPISEYYEKLGICLKTHNFNEIAKNFFDEYNQRFHTIELFAGVESLVQYSKQKTKSQFVLSALEQSKLDKAIDHFKLRTYFDRIKGLDNDLAHSKVESGRQLIEQTNLNTKKTLLIGDTDHDLEVAKDLGTQALLIADGHQSECRLRPLHDLVYSTRFI